MKAWHPLIPLVALQALVDAAVVTLVNRGLRLVHLCPKESLNGFLASQVAHWLCYQGRLPERRAG